MTTTKPLFPLGRLFITPGAQRELSDRDISVSTLIDRHMKGDSGEMDPQDVEANDQALAEGGRIFSSYRIDEGCKVWVITEADRRVTTILLPLEY